MYLVKKAFHLYKKEAHGERMNQAWSELFAFTTAGIQDSDGYVSRGTILSSV